MSRRGLAPARRVAPEWIIRGEDPGSALVSAVGQAMDAGREQGRSESAVIHAANVARIAALESRLTPLGLKGGGGLWACPACSDGPFNLPGLGAHLVEKAAEDIRHSMGPQ